MAVYDVDGNIICGKVQPVCTDEECTTTFLAYMNTKCSQYGMNGTYYASPSGLTHDSYSVPQDGMKLCVVVSSYPKALEVWATPSRDFSVNGNHARTISVTNNTIGSLAEVFANTGYKFLGGKGGSLTVSNTGYHRAHIDLIDVEGVPVVVSLMTLGQASFNNIFVCVKELCDMVKASLNGETPVAGSNLNTLVSAGGGYAACLVPNASGAYVNLVTPAELLSRAHSVSASPTAQRWPASTSKVMTMLCALDYITDPNETITIKTVDISSGSGSTFYDGDTLNVYDALKIMMMESSNTLASAIGRHTGYKILGG